MVRKNEPSQSSFDAASFVERVLSTAPRPIVASGLSSRAFQPAIPNVRQAAQNAGFDLVVIDCARTEHAFADVISERLQAAEAARGQSRLTFGAHIRRAPRSQVRALPEAAVERRKRLREAQEVQIRFTCVMRRRQTRMQWI